MTPAELKTLILSDPQATQLFNLPDDAACAERCNVIAPDVITRELVDNWEFKKHAIENGYWAVVVIFSEAGATVPGTDPPQPVPFNVRGLCISVLAWLTDPKIEKTDMDLPSTQLMIGGLLQAGIITNQHAQELSNLANKVTRPVITAADVEFARKRI